MTNYPALVWKVATGSLRKELLADRAKLLKQRKTFEELTAKIPEISDPARQKELWDLRLKARDSLNKQLKAFNEAAEAHNEVSDAVKTASAGTYDPGRVGLAAAPLVWVVGVAGALTAVLIGLSMAIDSYRSESTKVRGYLDQMASVIGSTADLVDASRRLALVGMAVLAGYVVYNKFWKKGGARRGGSTAPSLTLKPVSGSVVA